MKTFRNQLLLKLTRYLTGQISTTDIVTWAREEYSGKKVARWYVDPFAERHEKSLLLEILETLCHLPEEHEWEYAVVRNNLKYYQRQLENYGGRSPI